MRRGGTAPANGCAGAAPGRCQLFSAPGLAHMSSSCICDVDVVTGPAFDGWNADESSWPILLDEFVEFAMDKAKA